MRTLRERHEPWGFSYTVYAAADGSMMINDADQALLHEHLPNLGAPGCSFLQTPLQIAIGSADQLPDGDQVDEWESIEWQPLSPLRSVGARSTARSFLSYESLDGQTHYRPDCTMQRDVAIELFATPIESTLRSMTAIGAAVPIRIQQQMRLDRVTEYLDVIPSGFARAGKQSAEESDIYQFTAAVNRRYTLID
jgi:hypothetical protein